MYRRHTGNCVIGGAIRHAFFSVASSRMQALIFPLAALALREQCMMRLLPHLGHLREFFAFDAWHLHHDRTQEVVRLSHPSSSLSFSGDDGMVMDATGQLV